MSSGAVGVVGMKRRNPNSNPNFDLTLLGMHSFRQLSTIGGSSVTIISNLKKKLESLVSGAAWTIVSLARSDELVEADLGLFSIAVTGPNDAEKETKTSYFE
jgi:hypothetical protein